MKINTERVLVAGFIIVFGVVGCSAIKEALIPKRCVQWDDRVVINPMNRLWSKKQPVCVRFEVVR